MTPYEIEQLSPLFQGNLKAYRYTSNPKRKLRSIEEVFEAFPEIKEVFIDGTERRVE